MLENGSVVCRIRIAAVIVSDPALIAVQLHEAPGLEIHLSTQASAITTNADFWKRPILSSIFMMDKMSL